MWMPFGGENALIVQPGTEPTWVETRLLATGPTAGPELAVGLTSRLDPALATDRELGAMSPAERDQYVDAIDYDKIGGSPNFFQGTQYPDFSTQSTSFAATDATPILMVGRNEVTGLNLGDAGRGVAFLSADQTKGAYLWFN